MFSARRCSDKPISTNVFKRSKKKIILSFKRRTQFANKQNLVGQRKFLFFSESNNWIERIKRILYFDWISCAKQITKRPFYYLFPFTSLFCLSVCLFLFMFFFLRIQVKWKRRSTEEADYKSFNTIVFCHLRHRESTASFLI